MCYSIAMAHAGGRPPLYKTPQEMQKVIDKYFAECDPHWEDEEYWDYPYEPGQENLEPYRRKRDYQAPMVKMKRKRRTEQQPYTMAGLARRLGMSRQALIDYKNKDEFLDTISKARSKVEEYNERHLLTGKNVTGAIFLLKVNHGYKEDSDDNPPPENPIQFINNVPIDGPQVVITHNVVQQSPENS